MPRARGASVRYSCCRLLTAADLPRIRARCQAYPLSHGPHEQGRRVLALALRAARPGGGRGDQRCHGAQPHRRQQRRCAHVDRRDMRRRERRGRGRLDRRRPQKPGRPDRHRGKPAHRHAGLQQGRGVRPAEEDDHGPGRRHLEGYPGEDRSLQPVGEHHADVLQLHHRRGPQRELPRPLRERGPPGPFGEGDQGGPRRRERRRCDADIEQRHLLRGDRRLRRHRRDSRGHAQAHRQREGRAERRGHADRPLQGLLLPPRQEFPGCRVPQRGHLSAGV